MSPLLEVRGVEKRFGPVPALHGVDLDVGPGEIHAVLGENGAGKTTLMNVLYGIVRPDAGRVLWRGEPARLASPAAALALGIGMVHQHFTLVERLTVWENLWLAHPERPRLRLAERRARREARERIERHRLRLDPDALVAELPVGARQRVEIAKALARRCALLILDEPTAVLAPAETRDLFEAVRALAREGTALLFITHKLDEALAVADRITVLRRGRVVARCRAGEADRRGLGRAIVGEGGEDPFAGARRPGGEPPRAREAGRAALLSVEGLGSRAGRVAVREVAFELRAGEILGVAGIDGNGQEELAALLAGLARASSGRIRLAGEDVTRLGPAERWRRGLSVLPGDRAREGLLLEAAVWENLALREFGARWARRRPGWVDPARHRERARELVARHGVRAAGIGAPTRTLSGGNQQKLLLARELAADPRVLVLVNPTRGLDLGAAASLARTLEALRRRGRAILFFSTECEEVAAIADRWAVMRAGRLLAVERGRRERLGAMMIGGEA